MKKRYLLSIFVLIILAVPIAIFHKPLTSDIVFACDNIPTSLHFQTEGIRAISPSYCEIDPTKPTYTKQDVVQFINQQHMFTNTTGKPPEIDDLEFLTAQEASTRLDGESIDRPSNAIVCYVALKGSFMPNLMMSVPPGVKVHPSTIVQIVFDGRTGNILIWGTR